MQLPVKNNASIETMSPIFKAMSDPVRLQILQYLCCSSTLAIENSGDVRPVEGVTVGEVCCKITGTEKVSSTISRHIKELRLSGLIVVERKGTFMYCRMRPETLKTVTEFVNGLANNLEKPYCNGDC